MEKAKKTALSDKSYHMKCRKRFYLVVMYLVVRY